MRKLVQVISLLGALLVGPSGLYSAHREALGREAELGSVAEGASPDWQTPVYWGLKAGSYIPQKGCWGGNFKASRNHNKFDYEICAKVKFEGADAWVY